MLSISKRTTAQLIVAAAGCAGLFASAPASAGPAETGAVLDYEAYAVASASSIAADAVKTNDNLTCSVPTAGGNEVTPRVQYVVGEEYANDVVFGEWDCESRQTGVSYTISGSIKDMYYSTSLKKYVSGGGSAAGMTSVVGAAAVAPYKLNAYGAGEAANNWHFALFTGTTNTGRHVTAVSPLFYVASN